MTDIIIQGIGGRMGHVLCEMIAQREDCRVIAGIDVKDGEQNGIPVYDSLEKLDGKGDVVIDFSNPANLPMVTAYCEEHKCPAVIATTGFSDEETAKIQALGQEVPVVFSANYSLGINVMKRVVAEITPILEDAFDIEIIEKHHNKKLDAPSGTAKMLLSAADPDGAYDHVYGREGNRKRGKEIGIHAVRAGSIAGEHTVLYAGDDELLEIKHTAGSKKIFAAGALKAAAFAAEAKSGYYTMEDVLFG